MKKILGSILAFVMMGMPFSSLAFEATQTVKTGDSIPVVPIVIVLVLSLIIIITLIIFKTNNKNKK
ncbi:MAG: hypothetical protein RR436_07305 [Clostridia bacterium]